LESASAITEFFSRRGYTEDTFNRLGLSELPWSALATLSESGWSIKGDRLEQISLRALEKPPVNWESIIAAVEKLWGEPWEKISQRYVPKIS
jgi:hypothetical protein